MWVLKAGRKEVDFLVIWSLLLPCSMNLDIYHLASVFFTCKMELSLSPWATLLLSMAVLSLLYPSPLCHTYIYTVSGLRILKHALME